MQYIFGEYASSTLVRTRFRHAGRVEKNCLPPESASGAGEADANSLAKWLSAKKGLEQRWIQCP